jgi:two-component system, sensor histidine kinase FlrB
MSVTATQRNDVTQQESSSLLQAFSDFNQLSERLSDAYAQLEGQVAQLSGELTRSRSERQRERQQKERLADRLATLLEALPAAVVLVDRRDRIDRFNVAAERLFGGLSWGRLWREVRQEDLLGELPSGEWLVSGERCVNVSRQPLGDGGQILVMVDVTEQRELETRLNRQDRLAEMGELAAQLAHQIRTPLATALLYGGQLGRPGLTDEQRSRFADQLADGLRHTEKLVSDMLAFSRGEHFTPVPLSLRQVVGQAVDTLQPRLTAERAEVLLALDDGNDRILGNADALAGVLCNLFDNSLNHGGADTTIWVTLTLDATQARIQVEDDGPGIAPDARERIFDPFFTTRERGTGLGLAVAQSVLLTHGGSIRGCRSTHGGACFDLRLPLQPSPQGEAS